MPKPKKPLTVYVEISDGLASYKIPSGVVVDVIDYDTCGEEDCDYCCRCKRGGPNSHHHWQETNKGEVTGHAD